MQCCVTRTPDVGLVYSSMPWHQLAMTSSSNAFFFSLKHLSTRYHTMVMSHILRISIKYDNQYAHKTTAGIETRGVAHDALSWARRAFHHDKLKMILLTFGSCFGGLHVPGYVQLSFPEPSPSCHVPYIYFSSYNAYVSAQHNVAWKHALCIVQQQLLHLVSDNDDLWEIKVGSRLLIICLYVCGFADGCTPIWQMFDFSCMFDGGL